MSYVSIRGAAEHSPGERLHVERAAATLSKVFGQNYVSPEEIRACLTNPANLLLASEHALALLLGPGTVGQQKLWLMWVSPEQRGKGIGSALLEDILSTVAAGRLLKLDCPPDREAFYKRHGFQTYMRAEGTFCYMAGPAETADELDHLLPPPLRRRS